MDNGAANAVIPCIMAGENIKNSAVCGSINDKQNGWRTRTMMNYRLFIGKQIL
jgi:hypothetical protein